MSMKLPPRTVERLSKYRCLLDRFNNTDEEHISSRKLVALLNLSPEQVRRDLMLIGLTGNHRKGYDIKALVGMIGRTIDRNEGHQVALVGIGNLGRAVLGFIKKSKTKHNIVTAFDIDKNKINARISDVRCYDLCEAGRVIPDKNIPVAILTVPPEAEVSTASLLLQSGIRGILNFTSVHLDVPSGIYLKDYDIITSLEETGFFIQE
jgi:redox-sensing transcriptional repressor